MTRKRGPSFARARRLNRQWHQNRGGCALWFICLAASAVALIAAGIAAALQ